MNSTEKKANSSGAAPEGSTIGELIGACADRLTRAQVCFGHGTLSAQDEAVWLVLWALELPLDDLDGVSAQTVPAAGRVRVAALLEERIAARKPLAYLTREAWLQGISFYVDERTIVPRSLIAELIADSSIDPWLSPQTQRVLDLCTGNGSLAVLACMAWPEVSVDASDLSADALEVARINVDRHALAGRIQLLQGDGLAAANGQYDLILCNPPYVNSGSMSVLPAEYRAEPELALAGGADGMDFIRRLLERARHHLSERGVLVLEVGNERDHFEAAFPMLEAVWLQTSAGDDGVLLLTREGFDT